MGELANHLHGVDNAASRRKVTRMLRRRESETGKMILLGGGHGRALYTTMQMLAAGAPELVDRRDQMAGMLEEFVDDLREDVRSTRDYARGVGRRVAVLNTQQATLTKIVTEGHGIKLG